MSDETSKSKSIYGGSYKIKTEVLTRGLEGIKINEFKELGNRFKENMELLDYMISLPAIILAIERAKFNLVVVHIRAALRSGVRSIKEAKQEQRNKFLEEVKRIWEADYAPKAKELISEALDDGEKSFSEMLRSDIVYEPYRSLLYAGIVWTWCSFEVLMKDLWEAALNMRGKHTRKSTLRGISRLASIQSDSLIQGKYISLDYLAKYDYNLSNSLGTALVYKFDFTSPYGIKEAYLCAFPRSVAIRETLENKVLIELEARRNVIVHRAGILDAVFCDKTGTNRKEISNKLELSSEDVYEFGDAVIDIGLRVIKAVSSIISGRKAKT